MDALMNKILECVKKEGIDLIGFAPRSRFEGIDPAHSPFSIFPDGKTVILVGKRICRGALRGVEEGTNFGDYNLFGKDWLEDEFLACSVYALTNVLEDEGWEAVPLFPNPADVEPMGVPVEPGRPAPNVYPDFDYAAVACGLCELSYMGIPFSPKFGSRQRFHMIITDAELQPTPILEQWVCDGCMQCADVCPLGAISKTEFTEITVCGKTMKVAKLDMEKCRACRNGAVSNRLNADSAPDRVAALCSRTCMCHLEEAGLVGNRFENEFRKRAQWTIGGQNAQQDKEKTKALGGAFLGGNCATKHDGRTKK